MINLFKAVPTGEELSALKDVLDSGWWGQGKKVEEFEKAFAEYTGAKYAVATNSCTAALDIAVRVAPLGDTVTVSPFTFVSSALCILNAGKQVQFVDIDEETLCTPKADIQVLYAGNDAGEGIIYDMAHSGGAKHKGLISCWSFHAVKNLPTGDGGMLTTNDEEIYRRAKAIGWCGIDKSTYARSQNGYSWDYDIKEAGLKANMTDLTAVIGLSQLKLLDERNKKRQLVAYWYHKYLPESIKRPFTSKTWHLYTIRVPERDKLYEILKENDIIASVHYKPLYHYPIFPQEVLPVSERVYQEIISLPMNIELTEEDVKKVCDVIRFHLSIVNEL
jgi:perosamine synthetase